MSRGSANLRHRRQAQLAIPADAVPPTPPPGPNGALTATDGVEQNVRRRWVIFAVVSMALLMGSIDQTIVATALPRLQHDLHTTVNRSGWTITAYQLGAVLTLPGIALGHAFTIFALVILLVAIPLVFTVPSRRGTW